MKLYVGNLSFVASEDDLMMLFSEAGTVTSVNIAVDGGTGRPRGFGFVEMSSQEEGENAIAFFNGRPFNGRALVVSAARER